MIATPTKTKQHSTTVAAIDAADMWNGSESELGMAEVVVIGSTLELGVGVTCVVAMTVVRATDAVVVVAVLPGEVSGMFNVGAGSLPLAVKVIMRSEAKSSILVLESSVDVSCEESSVEGRSSV
jgi:hypothetical protein